MKGVILFKFFLNLFWCHFCAELHLSWSAKFCTPAHTNTPHYNSSVMNSADFKKKKDNHSAVGGGVIMQCFIYNRFKGLVHFHILNGILNILFSV